MELMISCYFLKIAFSCRESEKAVVPRDSEELRLKIVDRTDANYSKQLL